MATPHPVAGSDIDIAARDHVRAVTKAAGSSFYWGMRILPEARRDAMFAIYAFCREVDDIADGDDPAAAKRTALDRWRAAIDSLYDAGGGVDDHPVIRALAPAVRVYGLERADFHAVIDGMQMDVERTMLGPAWDELELYCSRVAGAVGLLSIRVFGDSRPRARDFALSLGTALQLTNILRDLEDDARMGRLYLPRESLDAHGVAAGDPRAALADARIGRVCAEVAEVARTRYAEAAAALEDCDARALRPAVVMMMNYRRVLDRLIEGGWRDLAYDAGLSGPEKLWITLRYGVL